MIHLITFRAMGCQVTVQLESEVDGAGLLQSLPARFADVEAKLTRFKPDSELMRVNACAGDRVTVSNVLFENIRAARHAALLTDGLYNPLVLPALIVNGYDQSFEKVSMTAFTEPEPIPDWHGIELSSKTHEVRIPAGSALDLGGIAKGWMAERIANELAEYGACLVNIGGDMVGRGAPHDLPGWHIEIEDPFTGTCFASLYLHNQSIVTSGTDYRNWHDSLGNRHHHIIDPRTGQSARTDVLSATVLHPTATTGEAYAKALILQGAEAGLQWVNQQWHTTGLVFQQDGTVLATSTFTASIIDERNTLS